jgi:glycosyltransferase involved in cell wall biosynthesis
MLDHLSGLFDISVHYPGGSHPLNTSRPVPSREWAFPEGERIRGLRRAAAPLVLPARLRALDRLCLEIGREIDRDSSLALVHNSMFVAAPPLLRYLSVPSVYFCYEYPRHIYEGSLVRRTRGPFQHLLLSGLRKLEKRMDLEAARSADATATLSSWMAGRLSDIYGVSPAVVSPGVDTQLFRRKEGAGREYMVLSVGALWPFKGHDTVIESLALMPGGLRPRLTVVADREFPGYADSLSASAEELGVCMEIRTGISDSQLVELYSSARAVLCCQRKEPYGLVPLEAMACGTPVVAVNEGGFRDNVLSGRNGILVERDPGSIAAALELVLTDGDLAEALGREGRLFVTTERTSEAAAEKLSGILMELL